MESPLLYHQIASIYRIWNRGFLKLSNGVNMVKTRAGSSWGGGGGGY